MSSSPHDHGNVRHVQRWFADAVTGAAEPPGSAVDRVLTPGPRMTAVERLGVYRSGYRARLVECLADDYPAVKHLLGDDAFEALANRYIEAHPSRSPNLNAFGRALPAFAAAGGLDPAASVAAFACDLARLEWAMVEAIHAAPADPIPPERLAAIPPDAWPGARLTAAPSVRLLRFDHPVDAYYQAFRDGREASVVTGSSATLVHRHGWVVWRRDLTPGMARLLDRLLQGAPLGEALAAAVPEGDGNVERDVTAWFQDWVASGVFSGVRA